MNMSPVSRLKKTWSKVKTAKFDILEVSSDDDEVLRNHPHKDVFLPPATFVKLLITDCFVVLASDGSF